MLMRDIGSHIRVVDAIVPTNASAGTVTGTGIDRYGLGNDGEMSCVLRGSRGADAGGASPHSVAYAVEHSTASGSGYVALNDRDGNAIVIAANTTDDSGSEVSIDLSGADRYIRVVATVVLTGGTSPTLPIAAMLVFGGALVKPD